MISKDRALSHGPWQASDPKVHPAAQPLPVRPASFAAPLTCSTSICAAISRMRPCMRPFLCVRSSTAASLAEEVVRSEDS